MILDELHVLERSAGPIGQGHAVAVLDGGVGREGKDAAAAAGTQDDGLGGDGPHLARHQFDGDDALNAAVLDEQLGDEALVVAH